MPQTSSGGSQTARLPPPTATTYARTPSISKPQQPSQQQQQPQTARVSSTISNSYGYNSRQGQGGGGFRADSSLSESKEGGGGPDYSSSGASVEERRPQAYTLDFIRAFTPRTLRACSEEGVVPRELLWKPLECDEFGAPAYAAATTGVIAVIAPSGGQGQQQQESEEMARIRQLRFKEYETSRLVALQRVRTTRRRNISGLRHTLFGITNKDKPSTSTSPTNGGAGALLPSVASHSTLQSSNTSRTHSRSHLHEGHHHHHGNGKAANNGSRTQLAALNHHASQHDAFYPPQHQIKEHPFFKAHPQHDRVHNLQVAPGLNTMIGSQSSLAQSQSTLPQALEWNATSVDGRSHLCVRMRDHLMRERERAEWEAEEEKRERRERKRRELLENEWYQEKKVETILKKVRNGGKSTGPEETPSPRLTRTEMLRAGPAHSGFLSNTKSNQNGLASTLPSSSGRDNSSSNQQLNSTQPNPSQGDAPATSRSFAQRHAADVAAAAERYTNFFEREKVKIVARQENEIQRLAASERYRFELQKKQEDRQRRRLEKQRQERLRREALAVEQQRIREAKYARVTSEEQERLARIEGVWEERSIAAAERRRRREAEIDAGIRERQTAQEQQDEERKWKVELAHHARHQRLVEQLHQDHARFEESRARLLEAKERVRKERESLGLTLAQKLQTAAERQHADAERRLHASLARTEKHAARDTSSMVKHAQEVAALRAQKAKEKEESKALVLAAAQQAQQAKLEALAWKDERDAMRLKQIELEKAEALVLLHEKNRLEALRKQRNLEREERKAAFHQRERAEKLEADLKRQQGIAAMKQEYVAKREEFAKKSFNATREFRETYTKLRTHGALAAITREAKQRQREIDLKQQEEQYA